MPEDLVGLIHDVLSIFNIWKQDVLAVIKVPTPIKIVQNTITDANGCLGGAGLDDPTNALTLWECPMSHEAWVHVINATSPEHQPAAPLDTGQILIMGSTGQIITWSPQPGQENNVLPVELLREGGLGAAHLTPGERIIVVGDQLPPGIHVRFDLQINLVAGVSPATPIPFIGTSIAEPSSLN